MLAQISHERSQALLRQRNLFALTSAGLAIALVVAGGLAATRDREVVLVPTLRAAADDFERRGQRRLPRIRHPRCRADAAQPQPRGARLLDGPDPRTRRSGSHGHLKAELVRIVEEQRGSDVTQAFVIKAMKVDPRASPPRSKARSRPLSARR